MLVLLLLLVLRLNAGFTTVSPLRFSLHTVCNLTYRTFHGSHDTRDVHAKQILD